MNMTTLTGNATKDAEGLANTQKMETRLASTENPEVTAIDQKSKAIIQDYETTTIPQVLTATYEAEKLLESIKTKAVEESLGLTATTPKASGG